jgi:hypothetical protein
VLKLIDSHFYMLRSTFLKCDHVLKRLRHFQIGGRGVVTWNSILEGGRGVHSHWVVYVRPYVEGLVQTY